MSEPATPISDYGLKGEVTIVEPDRQQRTVARRSAESRATVPTVEYNAVVDADGVFQREREIRCGLAAAVVAASAHALRMIPRVNGSYRDGRYELYSRVNVGVVFVDESVYVTPTIFDADAKSAAEIGAELASLRGRARDEELRPSELTGATFTVVDSSRCEIETVSPLVLPPQAGTLAFGPVRDVPVLRSGQVVPGRTMQLSLAVDHRIVYGHEAAAFLGEVRVFLEEVRV